MVVENLSFSFGDKIIFSELNMVFPKGEVVGIVGKNGVGKTTLFRVLNRIYQAKSGRISYEGQAVLQSDIGFLPTSPYFYPFIKGKEYLELVLGTVEPLEKLADLFELPLEKLVQTYSTGMKKKLAFAGIMGMKNRIQILDEPFNGVDLQSNLVLKQILTLKKDEKVTIVSSHILETMLDLCDKIYFIEEGFKCSLYCKDDFGAMQSQIAKQMEQKILSYQKQIDN